MSNRYYLKQSAIKECLLIRKNAIARNTKVGATLYTDDTYVSGWNIENRIHKGYHAEEIAIINARLRGINPKNIEGMVICFDKKDISNHTFCCGFCRQVLWEFTFNSDLIITEVGLDGKIVAEKTLGDLYPNPFPLEEFQLKNEHVGYHDVEEFYKD